VGAALLNYLPEPLGQDFARYLIAGLGTLATISTLGWAAAWLRAGRASSAAATEGNTAATPLLFGIQSPSVSDLFDASREALLGAMVSVGSDDDELVGWQHFYHEAGRLGDRPTAIGTCYGLKSMLLLGGTDRRFRQRRVEETLWRLQMTTGGWVARTQSTVGRPEVSAWVLSALLQAGRDRATSMEGVRVR
jgi:hypothetical protein